MARKKMRLGELLISIGTITDEELKIALQVQKKNKDKLGNTLIQLGYITNEDITRALEYQLGVPRIDLSNYDIPAEIPKLIDENIAKKYLAIPIAKDISELELAMADPLDIIAIKDIERITGYTVKPKIVAKKVIINAIEKYYSKNLAENAITLNKKIDKNKNEDLNEEPIVRLVNSILSEAIEKRASDIHIQPEEYYLKISLRIDGDLQIIMKPKIEMHKSIIARIKIMASMPITEKRKPLDGRLKISVSDKNIELRISTYPTVHGEKMVLRVQDRSRFLKTIDQLDFHNDDKIKFERNINKQNGIILITGPTGSGKSTTMYSILNKLNNGTKNITTIEDPVEYNMEGITQGQTNSAIDFTFATGLRALLRQDPDIIMVGEIRDDETAKIATTAAITGHLVLSTLHTNSAVETITRLLDMGIKEYMLASSLKMVVAQTLVRKLCPYCKEEYPLPIKEKEILNIDTIEDVTAFRAKGCSRCNQKGYFDRIGIHEIVEIDEKIKILINEKKSMHEIKQYLKKINSRTMVDNARELVLNGKTSIEEYAKIYITNNIQ